MLQTLPNPSVLLAPMTVNEAVLSSRIEGTQATLEEVLEQDAGIAVQDAARSADIQEIANYRSVLRMAEGEMERRPLSLSFVRMAHQVLMQGVRGRTKTPGSFRTEQNWIGRNRSSMGEARFIPPDPLALPDALARWEAYLTLHEEDPILHVAVAHAQFEILHPFKDGNGRIGRVLVPLLLFQDGALSRPMFYLSEELERRRDDYHDRLLAITDDDDWQGWIMFFAGAVIEQAGRNITKIRQVRELYAAFKDAFISKTRSQYAVPVLDTFFERLIVDAGDLQKAAGIPNRVTANRLLNQLEEEALIRKVRAAAGQRPAVYALSDLLAIIERRDVV
jgi:Fic family protein